MPSKLFDLLPLVRAPLLLTSAIGLILSAIGATNLENSWYSSPSMPESMWAMVSFYAISIVSNAIFAYTDHRRGGLKLNKGRIFVPANIVKAVADLGVGLAFLVLHIFVSTNISNQRTSVVLAMYASFGALIASILHGILAIHSAGTVLRAWKMNSSHCPTCHQSIRRCDSPALYAAEEGAEPSFRDERKGGESSIANRESSFEGDRLIVPTTDEA